MKRLRRALEDVPLVPCALLLALAAPLAAAQSEGEDFPDYASLSLEELMTIELEVTSVSRRSQSVADSAAAVYVLTQEDLRRSGATTIMEALRMVPGVNVARVGSNLWAVSARGHNDLLATKLLVLIDGRTVYTPLFSGTFWDVQDYPLADIERIEVIRGPGATMWGANAVNGVINIITKSAHDTHGGLVVGTLGTWESSLTARYGGVLGETGSYRAYGRWFGREALDREQGFSNEDDWNQVRGGFRADWSLAEGDTLTLQGDAYDGVSNGLLDLASFTSPPSAPTESDADVRGGNVLSRYRRELDDGSSYSLQAYFDYTFRDYEDFLRERRSTLDLDFQHNLPIGNDAQLIWGLGYRLIMSNLGSTPILSFAPEERNDQLFSTFAQAEVGLTDEVSVIVGSKLEHNDYTGFEVQPTARALWRASEDSTFWGAVSRAIRTPSQGDADVSAITAVIPGAGFNNLVTLIGDDIDAEELWAYELGHRRVLREGLSLDVALFWNEYDETITREVGAPFPAGGDVVVPVTLDNKGEGTAYGLEVATEWAPSDAWRVNAAYAFLDRESVLDDDSTDTTDQERENLEPKHQAHLRGYFDLADDVELNPALYWVDRLRSSDIDAFFRADVALEWRVRDGVVLALVAQNLFHDGETEFGQTLFTAGGVEVERAFYVQLRLGGD
ncbi:MAG: TonB-dependent receptor [Planctomycetota bacterium]